MLQITVPETELYDEVNKEFITVKEHILQLEHSLVSISKWESKWCIPFLDNDGLTDEQTIDYIRCMTLNKNVDPNVYKVLTEENIKDVSNYIGAPMTATTFRNQPHESHHEIVTSELIYYWMIALNIPPEYQKWHIKRLLTLIQVCNIKNSPPKKRSRGQMIEERRALNAARKKQFNTKG